MIKYFIEIRNRLILLLFTCIATFFISYFYKEILIFSIIQSSLINFNSPGFFYLIFTDVSEIFYAHISLILFIISQIGILYLIYQLFAFLTPALLCKEHFHISFLLKVCFLVWCFSLFVTHFVIIPLTWKFFLSFQTATKSYFLNLYFETKLSEYLSFYISLCYLSSSFFQLFAILFLLLSYISTNLKTIKKFRKLNYYFFVLFSTLISPPDLFSQLFFSIICILTFEILNFLLVVKSFADKSD